MHVFYLIMFPFIKSGVDYWVTSGITLDRPTELWVAFGNRATSYPQHWYRYLMIILND